MAQLVLTVAGSDRTGLVRALADVVADHGGDWQRSELAELAGVFAGIVLVDVPDDRLDGLRQALAGLSGLLHITPYQGSGHAPAAPEQQVRFSVLGNDRPGIVRDVTAALVAQGLSIERLTSATREAPMAGGMLFEASVTARASSGADVAAAVAALERLAGEIQVDLTLA